MKRCAVGMALSSSIIPEADVAENNIRKQKGNSRGIKIMLIVTLSLSVFLVAAIFVTRNKLQEVEKDQAAWQESLDAEVAYSSELKEEGDQLTIDDIIRIARERFGLLFKNEIIVQPEE